MMKLGRFVVESHGHISTLYKSVDGVEDKTWTGLTHQAGDGELASYDNSPLTLYDMETYGIDMVVLKPSQIGTTNEAQLKIVEKHPDKFVAFCADQTTKLKAQRGEKAWNLNDAVDEIDAALATGKYCGIGEFMPRDWTKNYTYEERLEECRIFFDMARKYDVPIDFHEWTWDYSFNVWILLMKLAAEYQDVKVIVNHGGLSIGHYPVKDMNIRRCMEAAGFPLLRESNVYLEVGTWPAEMIRTAVEDPNIGPTQLLWGTDYGHVPQYIISHPGGQDQSIHPTSVKKWPPVPAYQVDWWGYVTTTMLELKKWVAQDEMNLILGGNAAKIFKLPVPHERMFLCGRPDVFGINWEESIPYIPREQVINPDFPDEE